MCKLVSNKQCQAVTRRESPTEYKQCQAVARRESPTEYKQCQAIARRECPTEYLIRPCGKVDKQIYMGMKLGGQ